MRILSKFKDYYDYVQGYGADPNLVYDRKTFTIKTDKRFNNCIRFNYFGKNKRKYYFYNELLYFCGNFYHYFHVLDLYFEDVGLFYLDDLEEIFSLELNKQEVKYFSNFKNNNYTYKTDEIPDNIPVALITQDFGKKIIVCNPKLEDFKFYKFFSPELCYQTIAQFLYSVKESKAKYEGEIMSDNVSDKDMLVAKGFDKYSFKKSKR